MALLSDVAILRHLSIGSIVIEPFDRRYLNNASYDLSVGPCIARYKDREVGARLRPAEVAGPEYFDLIDYSKEGEFVLYSGERVLAHTNEKVGGTAAWDHAQQKTVAVNSSIHSTSTSQRIGVSVCLDAGWGDIGFIHPFTLELLNHSPYDLVIPIGAILAQITFHEVKPPQIMYRDQGSYKGEGEWTPQLMLPKKMKVKDAFRVIK